MHILREQDLKNYLSFVLMSAVLPLTHLLGVMNIIVPAVLSYLASFKNRLRFHVSIILAAAFVLIVNAYWLVPFIKYSNYKGYVFLFHQAGLFAFLGDMTNGATANSGIILLIFFCYGLVLYWKEGKRSRALIFFSLFFWDFYLAYFGAYNKFIFEMEPHRFYFMLMIAMAIPAATAMRKFFPEFYARIKDNRAAMAFSILFLIVLFQPVVWKQLTRSHLHTRMPKEFYELRTFLTEHTSSNARILICESGSSIILEPNNEDAGMYYSILIPTFLRREIISDNNSYFFVKNAFYSDKIFSRHMPQNYPEYFDLLNISYIVTLVPEPKEIIRSVRARKLMSTEHLAVYEVKREPSFFLRGSGRTVADYNRIKVSGASKGSVVLKYHWFEALKTVPPLKIERYPIEGDPVGFIKVENGGVRDFTIYNAY